MEALLSDLPPFYCRFEFSVHIALSLFQFLPYSFPPFESFIYDGIGSFKASVKGWKAVVAWVEALLSDLPPVYCRYDFSVHIALSFLQFVLYSLPPLLSLILDGIGSFMTSVKRWKGVVARVEALLSASPPFYCRYDFSVHIALALLHFRPYSFPTLLRFIHGGIRASRQPSLDKKEWFLEWKHYYLICHPSTFKSNFQSI